MAFIVWGITFCDTPKITIHAALSSFTCTLKQRETLTCPHCPAANATNSKGVSDDESGNGFMIPTKRIKESPDPLD